MVKPQPLPSLPSLFRDAPLYVAYSLLERTPAVVAAEAAAARERSVRAVSRTISDNPPPPAPSKEEMAKAAVLTNRNAIDAYGGPLDAYCIWCKQPSVFRSPDREKTVWTDSSDSSILYKHFVCARSYRHRLYFAFIQIGYTIEKIGQLPSLADLGAGSLDKYRKALSEDLFAELHRAVGLCAHGVGVGSFVYLRRVFESLLEDAHKVAQRDAGWNEDEYQRQRVDERILSLHTHLPEFLVENRNLYGILSKGIHELGEEECLGHFPIVRTGIELVLDAVLARREQEEKTKTATEAIGRLVGQLKQVNAGQANRPKDG